MGLVPGASGSQGGLVWRPPPGLREPAFPFGRVLRGTPCRLANPRPPQAVPRPSPGPSASPQRRRPPFPSRPPGRPAASGTPAWHPDPVPSPSPVLRAASGRDGPRTREARAVTAASRGAGRGLARSTLQHRARPAPRSRFPAGASPGADAARVCARGREFAVPLPGTCAPRDRAFALWSFGPAPVPDTQQTLGMGSRVRTRAAGWAPHPPPRSGPGCSVAHRGLLGTRGARGEKPRACGRPQDPALPVLTAPRERGGVCPPRCAAPPPARPPTFPCSSAPLVHGDKHREASPPWCCCRKIEGSSSPWERRPGCRGEGGADVFLGCVTSALAPNALPSAMTCSGGNSKKEDRSAVDASPSHTARAVPDLGDDGPGGRDPLCASSP